MEERGMMRKKESSLKLLVKCKVKQEENDDDDDDEGCDELMKIGFPLEGTLGGRRGRERGGILHGVLTILDYHCRASLSFDFPRITIRS